MSVTLNEKQIKILYDMLGGEKAIIVIEYWKKGHSGKGYYAFFDACPDEGAIFLGETEE